MKISHHATMQPLLRNAKRHSNIRETIFSSQYPSGSVVGAETFARNGVISTRSHAHILKGIHPYQAQRSVHIAFDICLLLDIQISSHAMARYLTVHICCRIRKYPSIRNFTEPNMIVRSNLTKNGEQNPCPYVNESIFLFSVHVSVQYL